MLRRESAGSATRRIFNGASLVVVTSLLLAGCSGPPPAASTSSEAPVSAPSSAPSVAPAPSSAPPAPSSAPSQSPSALTSTESSAPNDGESPDEAALSPGAVAASVEPAAQVVTVTTGGSGLILEVLELNEWYRAALVDGAAIKDPRELDALVRPICEGKTTCRVGVWYDKGLMPTKMPVTLRQLGEQEFAFGRIYDGTENALWNCNKYPEFEAEGACLPREM